MNQNFSRTASPEAIPLQKFAYRYALFSTSGFSAPATDYALAHQISLVDLSTEDFADIVQLADDVARALWEPNPPSRAGGYVRRLRARLRAALDTWPEEIPVPDNGEPLSDSPTAWSMAERMLSDGVAAIGELLVAMANGPYLLILRSRHPQRVIELLDEAPVRDVAIHWSAARRNGTRWTVAFPGAELSFTFRELRQNGF